MFTVDSTVAEIMKKPSAKAIIEKHAGMPVDTDQLQMAMGMSLQQVASFVGWDAAKIRALLNDLNS